MSKAWYFPNTPFCFSTMKRALPLLIPSILFLGFVAFLFSRQAWNLEFTSAASFPDVNESDWFHPYVTELSEDGILSGRPDGRFGPLEVVNRAELAKVLSEFKKQIPSANTHLNNSETEESDSNSWLIDNLFEIILVMVIVLGWMAVSSSIHELARKPIVVQQTFPNNGSNNNHRSQPRRRQKKGGYQPLNEEYTAPPDYEAPADSDSEEESNENEEKNSNTNWWL